MAARVAVIDYGGGNIGSLIGALRRRGVEPLLTQDPEVVTHADAAFFPGDGAFAATMEALRERRLDRAIYERIERERPFFGICVGMQVLFEASSEFGGARGLGVLKGEVGAFERAARVPHMGWNRLELCGEHPLLAGLAEPEFAYFLHSYRALPGEACVATATHGERFAAIVASGAMVGTQFHPEKSQRTGAKILDTFLSLL
ncbi:MAG TPA: imidazole glycerol phosphate synthase subunit HisH [Candidatus Dormibacteraeota bacterium]|nr:imidazole glycerol phosphate synthase subunit HisH [Candidatus Dormibacteraeota bacterium]